MLYGIVLDMDRVLVILTERLPRVGKKKGGHANLVSPVFRILNLRENRLISYTIAFIMPSKRLYTPKIKLDLLDNKWKTPNRVRIKILYLDIYKSARDIR